MFQHIQCLKQYQKEQDAIPCDHQNQSFSPIFLFQQAKCNADLLILRVKEAGEKFLKLVQVNQVIFGKKHELFFQILRKYVTCINAIHNITRKKLGEDLGGAGCLPTTEQLDDLYGCTLACFLGIWLGDQLQVQLYDTLIDLYKIIFFLLSLSISSTGLMTAHLDLTFKRWRTWLSCIKIVSSFHSLFVCIPFE